MPPPMSAAMSFDTVAAQPTESQYAAERQAVLKRMAVLTVLAVALVAFASYWFGMLGNMGEAFSAQSWSGQHLRLFGGAAIMLVLTGAMTYVWLRLVRRLLRMDWA